MQIAAGQQPDNFIAPSELSEFERRTLRDAFAFVGKAQHALTVSFQTQYMQ
jgi:CBS domain-containing protein